MTTAYELSRPEHAGRYQVTVYQMGARLGGKGASGRGVADRIEEHGLHLWMGFYENAFRLMRECYAELGRDRRTCPIASWDEAFEPAPDVAVVDRTQSGHWRPWIAHFPPGRGLPGDPPTSTAPFSVRGYLMQAVGLLGELLRSTRPPGESSDSNLRPGDPAALVEAIDRLIRYGRLATAVAIHEAITLLGLALEWLRPTSPNLALPLLEALTMATRRNLELVASNDPELRGIWQVADLILAIIRGSLINNLAFDPRGFDAINNYDWIEWLRMHGASESSLQCGFVRGIYDLVFAYEDGDVTRPRLAAGVALRGSMRMFFTYRGALFWRMTAGMGDIVFAPLYEICKRRGVRFEFFHRLRNVGVAPRREDELPFIDHLEFDVQAEVRGGEYQPLIMVDGLPCWPSEPRYEQLVDGALLRERRIEFESPWEQRVVGQKRLQVGRDFDLVVLGIGIAAVPLVCAELLACEPRWRAMCQHGETAATQAFQLWMREDMRQLGWQDAQINLSGFVQPFDTWADMRHLIARESWPTRVKSLAYFCSVLPNQPPQGSDPERHQSHARAQHAKVRDNAIRFLDHHIGALWPNAVDAQGGFRWQLLASVDSGATDDASRFDSQFWTANVNPSDRYSLSVPGSIEHRISPLDLMFDNLTVAGDWTQTGLDSGCVESAVMSGLLAAHAISQSPPLESIIGYDHP
jgi:uncharacterized protein with NAD-binding domain and iron-sulfur cluster